jgi:two-component system, OmpR family, sensor kinase
VRTLFFNIYISFWLAMALILISAIGITATVAWDRFSRLGSIDPGQLIGSAATTLRDQGLLGLKTWLADLTNAHPDLDIYIVDASGDDILQRPLPQRIEQWLVLGGKRAAEDGSNRTLNWPYGYDLAPGGVTPRTLAFNRSHLLANPTIVGPDGSAYKLIVAWFGATPVDVLGSYHVVVLVLAIALGVSAVLCWWLARYISRPVAKLQMSARALALGNLDTQIDEQFCKRRDELGILAQDFNQMAARLRSQIISKETLLRDVSHELRTPLTRLRVALGLAQRGDGDLGIQLDRIERDRERLDALIEESLQLSRLSGAEPTLIREHIELERLLSEVVEDAQIEASATGKQVNLSAIPGLSLHGSPVMLRRAIENVLRNAIRFTPEGSSVDVSLRRGKTGVIISIRDHGAGVPEPELKKIFEAFYRVAEARDRSSGGTGLGLAITERIMAVHGGYAEARNAPDGGLVVELCFPETTVSGQEPDTPVKVAL